MNSILVEINLGNISRQQGMQKAKEHSSITRWFERWNETLKQFDFYLLYNPSLITNYEI